MRHSDKRQLFKKNDFFGSALSITFLLASVFQGSALSLALGELTYPRTAPRSTIEIAKVTVLPEAAAQTSQSHYPQGNSTVIASPFQVRGLCLGDRMYQYWLPGFHLLPSILSRGSSSTVTVSNYQQIMFERWTDGGTTASHSVKITQNISLIALYTRTAKTNQRALSETLRVTDAIQSTVFRPIPVQHISIVLPNVLLVQDNV